jgi:hypothetical protein
MIDNMQLTQWGADARVALMRYLGKDDEVSRLASIILALLTDREEREWYIQEQR